MRVDLSGTGPGVLGPATEFRAVWGDGRETEWQESPIFQHQYTLPQDADAIFYARNANQTSSQAVLFHVGQDPPGMNIFNSPLSDRYQETSLFLIGLLITGLVALAGVYRAGRKRRLLDRELRDLESDYARLHADPSACDQMLTQRRARGLYLAKKLEEAHASFLASRVDELRRGLRLGTVEERFKSLPHGLVMQLQRLLQDARVESWERDHFLAALEGEPSINSKQRQAVRRVIDEWFARDANTGIT